MTTLVFDIDNTLVDMWPAERCCLESLIGKDVPCNLKEHFNGDLYQAFCAISKEKLRKSEYKNAYKERFNVLLSSNQLSCPLNLKAVDFVLNNKDKYAFVFVTGGWMVEAEYALTSAGIIDIFDRSTSLSRDNCRFTKATGLPFKQLKKQIDGDMLVVSDSESDIKGATKVGVPSLLLKQNQEISKNIIQKALASV